MLIAGPVKVPRLTRVIVIPGEGQSRDFQGTCRLSCEEECPNDRLVSYAFDLVTMMSYTGKAELYGSPGYTFRQV